MKVIGITGGVGSGKSAVLKLLEEEYHAVVVQLDEVAKALQRKGTPCWKAIVEAFGREILDENEELDRKKLAQIVFQSSEKLEQLNGIVHPAVKQQVLLDIEEKEKRRQSCTYWRLLFFWKQDMPKSVKKHGLSIQRNR